MNIFTFYYLIFVLIIVVTTSTKVYRTGGTSWNKQIENFGITNKYYAI